MSAKKQKEIDSWKDFVKYRSFGDLFKALSSVLESFKRLEDDSFVNVLLRFINMTIYWLLLIAVLPGKVEAYSPFHYQGMFFGLSINYVAHAIMLYIVLGILNFFCDINLLKTTLRMTVKVLFVLIVIIFVLCTSLVNDIFKALRGQNKEYNYLA